MKIEVALEKRYAFLIFTGLLIVAGAIFAVAFNPSPGTVPNPGHKLTSIQSYFSGESSLNDTLGKFCQSDGTNCPSGLIGACELLGSRSPGQQPLAVDIPAGKCRGKPCEVILVSSSGTSSSFASFNYVQQVAGAPNQNDWIAVGGVRNEISRITFTNLGTQSDNSQDTVATLTPTIGQVSLLDDLSGIENSRDRWTLTVNGINGQVYVC